MGYRGKNQKRIFNKVKTSGVKIIVMRKSSGVKHFPENKRHKKSIFFRNNEYCVL